MSGRLTMDDLRGLGSPDFRARNPLLFAGAGGHGGDGEDAPQTRGKGPCGTPRGRRTKTEELAAALARRRWPEARVLEQALRLPLTGGGTYTPDLVVLRHGHLPLCVEVKGGYRGPGADQGYERYRRAAYEWGPWLEFALWERRRGEWSMEE